MPWIYLKLCWINFSSILTLSLHQKYFHRHQRHQFINIHSTFIHSSIHSLINYHFYFHFIFVIGLTGHMAISIELTLVNTKQVCVALADSWKQNLILNCNEICIPIFCFQCFQFKNDAIGGWIALGDHFLSTTVSFSCSFLRLK